MADVKDLEPKQVVMRFFEAFGRQDAKVMAELLADDVDWVVLGGAKNIPFAGKFHGADTVIGATTANIGSTENVAVAPTWFVAEGDKVVVLMHEEAKVTQTGRSYEVDSIHVYTVKGGKIVRFDNYFNPLPILEATFGDVIYIPPAQTLPKLTKEEWVFFEGDNYHHYETVTYEYDEQGRRKKGELDNLGRGVKYNITYKYDENGKGTGEEWVNAHDPKDKYVLTYRYDPTNKQILGGKGAGQNSWAFNYEYDEKGRKIKMTNTYSNGNSWAFTYDYDMKTGKCVRGQGNAASGLRCIISYKYGND
jgi:uncharacterized protein